MCCNCGCGNKADKKGAGALLKNGVSVVNFGMESFWNDLKAQDAPVVQVDWKPSFAGKGLLSKLKKLKKGGE